MPSWRERIQAARERGSFSREDEDEYADRRSCLAAEVAAGYGVWFICDYQRASTRGWDVLWEIGDTISVWGMSDNDFDAVEQCLNTIEDRALALKRAMHDPVKPEATC